MKAFILGFLMSLSAFGAQSPMITVTGKVLSFDEKQVVLLVQNKKYSVPRDSILQGPSLINGKTVQAKIKNPLIK